MRAEEFMLYAYFFVLLIATPCAAQRSRANLESVVSAVEKEYADNCAQRASATWEELTGSPYGLSKKLGWDRAFGPFVKTRREKLTQAATREALNQSTEVLRQKVDLLLQVGDAALDTNQWAELVTFADTAQNKLRFATNYDCETGSRCSLSALHTKMATEKNTTKLLQMKQSWEKNLPDMNEYLTKILPLLKISSKGYNTVEEYWDSLVGYKSAMQKARELWDNLQPFYSRLQNYVAVRLRGPTTVGMPLPAHLLRSLNGDDWSNIIESLLPMHPAVYYKLQAYVQQQSGPNAYKVASEFIKSLQLGEIAPDVLSESIFNSTCPATLVDWCTPNKVRVVTCKDASIQNYLDAHETAMKIIYKQTSGLDTSNTHILPEATRYSALYEAIPGFVSLLALSSQALDRNGVFSFKIFDLNNIHHHQILQMFTALQDLPKLNFYLAADEWRLKVLTGAIPSAKAATSWSEFRKNFSMIETSDVDILSDPYVLSNKPLIGKFMGLILKYQAFQAFSEDVDSEEENLLDFVASNYKRLRETMKKSFSQNWPELVKDLLDDKANDLDDTGLTDYYQFLDEYLEVQLDPSFNEENELDDYLDPSEAFAPKDDFDLSDNPVTFDEPYTEQPELPKSVGKPNESSYSIYWWIGLGVALVIIVILIAIIARKRSNHKKQLERQREHSSA